MPRGPAAFRGPGPGPERRERKMHRDEWGPDQPKGVKGPGQWAAEQENCMN